MPKCVRCKHETTHPSVSGNYCEYYGQKILFGIDAEYPPPGHKAFENPEKCRGFELHENFHSSE